MYKCFPFRRYKERQVSLLATSRKDSIFSSQKNPIKCKALSTQWALKTCKFYGVSNTEEQFHLPRKLIAVVHRFLENTLVAASNYYHNHILTSKNCYQLPINFRRKVHHANVLIQNKSASSYLFLPTFLWFTLSEKQKVCATNIDLKKNIYIYICQDK